MGRALGRAAIVVVAIVSVVAGVAVVATASPSADPQHGISFSKGCTSPRQFGEGVACSFTVSNTLDSVNQAHDTVTFDSITDAVATAGGPANSGNIIASLLLTPQGGATCNVSGALPGTGNTLCTLPFGGSVTTNVFTLYTPITPADFAAFPATHRLLDVAALGWHDLCDGLDANPTPGGGNCNPEPGPAGAAGSTLIVDANVQITPNGTNEVIPPGQTVHTFTGHVNVSCQTIPADATCSNGNGYKNAPDGTTINFAFVGAHVGTLSAPSCVTAGGTGSCSVTDSSATPGVDTVMASTSVTVSGLALSRATGDAKPGDGPNAVKTWVDARITISPNGVNEIVPPGLTNHTFTGFVEVNNGSGWAPAPAGTTINFAIINPPSPAAFFVGPSTCLTAGATGQCQATIRSPASEIDTVRASTSVVVSGLTLNRATGDGHPGDSADALKTWVDANIQISPLTDTDPVGDTHTLTGHVNVSPGTGAYGSAPAGTLITFSIVSGPGSFVGPATCNTIGVTGSCSVQITSAVAGTTVIKAATNVTVLGVTMHRETGDGIAGDSNNAQKSWVDARIAITPSATNRVGTNHVFTVTVQTDSGAGFVNAPNGTLVTASITSGPGSFVGSNTCTTTSGACTVTITSAVTGVTVVSAATDVTVAGLSLHRVTDGTGGNSGPASKTWVNATIAITPTATNEVGQPHTFTVTLQKDVGDGAGFVAAAGEHVTVALTDSNGATHTAPTGTCTNAGPNTNGSGQCTITFTSNLSGKVTGHATSSLIVGGVSISLATDGVAPNSADAVKTFVDANIQISPPTDTDPAGDTHTLTGHVNVNAGQGAGFVNAPAGTLITFSITSGPGSFVGGVNTCTTTGATGNCSVQITSTTTGTTTIKAATDVTVGGLVIHRETGDGKPGDSPSATKTWVDAKIAITPNGVNRVGQNHIFTVTVQVDSGAGFVNAPNGTLVTASITSGPGSFVGGNTCTTSGGTGSCTVTITSAVTGTTIVSAATDVTVAGLPVHRVTDGTNSNSGPATKTWVNARISITPDATNPIGAPHTFTATLQKDLGDGAGFVAAAGEHVDVVLTDSNGATHTAPTGTCTTAGANTNASGQCTITFTSNTVGSVTGHASSTVNVLGVSMSVQSNGVAPNSPDAVKNFVDARIAITPNGTNQVGQNHVFTVTVQANSGAGFVNVPNGTQVTASITSGPGSFVGGTSCTTSGGTGSCTVTITSAVTGITIVSAVTDVTVSGVTMHRVTDGTLSNSGPATKTWVNAKIAIAPDATNPVGAPHTFTATLQKDLGNGAGFVAAPNEHVTVTLTDSNGAGHTAPTGTCTTAGANTDAAGQCTITFTSNTAGKVTAHAASTLTVSSVSITVQTNGVSPNSADAVKTFEAPPPLPVTGASRPIPLLEVAGLLIGLGVALLGVSRPRRRRRRA